MKAPNFTSLKVLFFVIGSMMVVASFCLSIQFYYDYKYPIIATIIETENACQVRWRENKVAHYKVLHCEDVPSFTSAGREADFRTVAGKAEKLSFRSPDGILKTETGFFDDPWLLKNSQDGLIPINYYPRSPNPIHRAPELWDAWLLVLLGLLGVIFPIAGLRGIRLQRRKYERQIAEGKVETSSPNAGKKSSI